MPWRRCGRFGVSSPRRVGTSAGGRFTGPRLCCFWLRGPLSRRVLPGGAARLVGVWRCGPRGPRVPAEPVPARAALHAGRGYHRRPAFRGEHLPYTYPPAVGYTQLFVLELDHHTLEDHDRTAQEIARRRPKLVLLHTVSEASFMAPGDPISKVVRDGYTRWTQTPSLVVYLRKDVFASLLPSTPSGRRSTVSEVGAEESEDPPRGEP